MEGTHQIQNMGPLCSIGVASEPQDTVGLHKKNTHLGWIPG